MLGILVYAALICAFAVHCNIIWAQFVFLITFGGVLVAAIAAAVGAKDAQVFRGAFAFAAGSYLFVAIVAPRPADFLPEATVIGMVVKRLDDVPSIHSFLLDQTRLDPNFNYHLFGGWRLISHSMLAMIFGALVARISARLAVIKCAQ